VPRLNSIPIPSFVEEYAARFWSYVDIRGEGECWPWLRGRQGQGYGCFSMKHRSYRAIRIAFFLEYGADPGSSFICHKCDNPICCNPEHFFLGRYRENGQDAAEKGRTCSGDRHHWRLKPETIKRGEQLSWTVLTAEKVIKIRSLRGKISISKLATMFGVSKPTISHIMAGRSWKHLLE